MVNYTTTNGQVTFHDVTSGSNGYRSARGYDLVTGVGTPLAQAVVSKLVAWTGTGFAPAAAPAGSTTTKTTTPQARAHGVTATPSNNLGIITVPPSQLVSATGANTQTFVSMSPSITTPSPTLSTAPAVQPTASVYGSPALWISFGRTTGQRVESGYGSMPNAKVQDEEVLPGKRDREDDDEVLMPAYGRPSQNPAAAAAISGPVGCRRVQDLGPLLFAEDHWQADTTEQDAPASPFVMEDLRPGPALQVRGGRAGHRPGRPVGRLP